MRISWAKRDLPWRFIPPWHGRGVHLPLTLCAAKGKTLAQPLSKRKGLSGRRADRDRWGGHWRCAKNLAAASIPAPRIASDPQGSAGFGERGVAGACADA